MVLLSLNAVTGESKQVMIQAAPMVDVWKVQVFFFFFHTAKTILFSKIASGALT